MKNIIYEIKLSTKGHNEIIDITDEVISKIKLSRVKSGIVVIFISGSTGGLTTMEYEPGLISDTKKMFESIIPERGNYSHDASHICGNAPAHLRASLIGPSLTIPIENSELTLGTWQQIVFIDFDNRPRQRRIIIKIIGE